MIMRRDWLWDKNIAAKEAINILHHPEHPRFITLASLLLSRKNDPAEVFREYLKPRDFCLYWLKIKRKMRKDAWNNPRIDFWQAVYERLLEKYKGRGKKIFLRKQRMPINEFCHSFGQKIKELRVKRKLTQKMLSDKLGISQQMISRIESGKENISLLTLKKITEILGASVVVKENK